MVSRLGFEPRTLGLKVRCTDQTELPAQDGGDAVARGQVVVVVTTLVVTTGDIMIACL